MKKRIFTLTLVLIMLLSSCNTVNEKDESKKGDSVVNSGETNPDEEKDKTPYELELERRATISDELDEITFENEDFVVLGEGQLQTYNVAEDILAETFNDALYYRDLGIEDRFKIDLKMNVITGDVGEEVRNSVLANDDSYDLVTYNMVYSGMLVLDDLFLDLRSLPALDFSKPWWNSSTDELLTVDNRTFLAAGAFNLDLIGNSHSIFYNLDIAKDYNLEDIYSVVLEGRWTLDKMEEMITGVWRDLNTNGEKDGGDLLGLSVHRGNLDNFPLAFGKKLTEPAGDGSMIIDQYYDEKFVSISERLIKLFYYNGDTYCRRDDEAGPAFESGNVLCQLNLIDSAGKLLDTEIDYAVIPMPKWDELQQEYYGMVDGGSGLQAVPKTADKLELIGTVIEALNAETWKTVEYPYYEKVLKGRQLQHESNLQVMDMIYEGRVFDFGYVYGAFSWNSVGGGASCWIGDMKWWGLEDITSFVTPRLPRWEAYIGGAIDYFYNYED